MALIPINNIKWYIAKEKPYAKYIRIPRAALHQFH
jgi:hypothetical protein